MGVDGGRVARVVGNVSSLSSRAWMTVRSDQPTTKNFARRGAARNPFVSGHLGGSCLRVLAMLSSLAGRPEVFALSVSIEQFYYSLLEISNTDRLLEIAIATG